MLKRKHSKTKVAKLKFAKWVLMMLCVSHVNPLIAHPIDPINHLSRFLDNRFSHLILFGRQTSEAEQEIEEHVEDEIEDEVEHEVENEVEDEIEDEVEHEVENEVEQEVENEVEQEVENEVEHEVENEVEQEVENEVEQEVENEVEHEVESEVEHEVENEVEQEVENEVEKDIEHDASVDDEIEDAVQRSILEGDSSELIIEKTMQKRFIERIEEHALEHNSQQVAKAVEQVIDIEGERIFSRDWLVLADDASLMEIEALGYSLLKKQYLDELDLYMAEIQAPASYDLWQENLKQLQALNSDSRGIDLNHLYGLSQYPNDISDGSAYSQAKAQQPVASQSTNAMHRLGMIDTSINVSHPYFQHSKIHQQLLVPESKSPSSSHGTQVASILIGKANDYQGMLPGQPIWSASVFFNDAQQQPATTTQLLLQALNWLLSEKVEVINLSLAGPPNKLLEIAVKRICEKNVLLVASTGNAGPAAAPQYPAAYPCTVSVTALDKEYSLYRRAGVGPHVDFASYGVSVNVAGDSGTTSVSGTSYAAPIVAGWLASHAPSNRQRWPAWLVELQNNSFDLGEKGKDDLFGYGILPGDPGRQLVEH